jgi:hypothetical protein
MKDFTRPRGRLRSLPTAARVVYSVFLGFTLLAMAMTAWLAEDMLGPDLAQLGPYYAGVALPPAHRSAARAPASRGPVLDLPSSAEAPSPVEPMPVRKLLEVTHFHLFSMPVYLLILSHLFMLSRATDFAKLAWIILGTISVAGHVAAPWLARSGSVGAAAVYGTTGVLMTLSFLVMSVVPLWEMWAPFESPHPTLE